MSEEHSDYLPVPVSRTLPAMADGLDDAAVVNALLATTPKSVIRYRPGAVDQATGQRRRYPYVPWSYYVRKLTRAFGARWSYHVTDLKANKQVYKGKPREEIMVRLVLTTPRGEVEGFGSSYYYPESGESSYGDAVKSARSYALRDAAGTIGIAGDIKSEVEESGDEIELREAQEAWRTLLRERSLTQKAAIELLSQDGKLPTLQDCLDATGQAGAAAYYALAVGLQKALAT